MKKIPQDIIGNIAILKFPRGTLWISKQIRARRFLREHKSVRTVLEKVSGFSGEFRILKTKHLAGVRTKNATYRENDCVFKYNIDETYFSPRLSEERKRAAEDVFKIVKENGRVLVMFAGVGPYPIVLASRFKKGGKEVRVFANELNSKAVSYMKKNVVLNKLSGAINIIEGDARTLPSKIIGKFDVILMPRPNVGRTFLKTALKMSKKGTVIFYHGFGTKQDVLDEVKKDVDSRVGVVSIRKAGDIGVGKWRWLVRFKVL